MMARVVSEIEEFNSPEQMQALLLQYPLYDVAITETSSNTGIGGIASGQGVQNFLKAPAWVDTLRQTRQLTVTEDVVQVSPGTSQRCQPHVGCRSYPRL